MTCDEVKATLAEDSSMRFEQAVSAHLSQCEDCHLYCEDLLELEDLSRALSGRFQVPGQFRAEVLDKIESCRSSHLSWSWALAAACVLLLVGSVGGFSTWSVSKDNAETVILQHNQELPVAELSFSKGEPVPHPSHVEIIVNDSEEGEVILRLPSEILIQNTELHEDFYIHQVSH